MPPHLQASEQSWPHFGHCDDLRVHLPTAISALKNMTRFRLVATFSTLKQCTKFTSWIYATHDPASNWLVNSVMQAVARLPHLTELNLRCLGNMFVTYETRIPIGLFGDLSKLSIEYGLADVTFFISQMSTVIANSPQLKSLHVLYFGGLTLPSPTLSDLFAKVSTKSPLCLEHLSTGLMDATVDQAMVPHLMQLTSFRFYNRNLSVSRSVWTTFLVNNIKLSDVEIGGYIAEEMISYLSSFSGLKRLVVGGVHHPPDTTVENLKNSLFMVVLKHVNSLQTLEIRAGLLVKPPNYVFCIIFSISSCCSQVFDHASSKWIMQCLKLRDLYVIIDEKDNSMPVVSLAKPGH
jgi:hypothetical protein